MERILDILNMQETVGASDEEVAVLAKCSSKTVQRAKLKIGNVSPKKLEAILEALDVLRAERNKKTSEPFKNVTFGCKA